MESKATMKVYESLLEEKERRGKLDIQTLTKEDLYIMYIIQKKQKFEISELYDVPDSKIASKLKSYKIKFFEVVVSPEMIGEIIDITNKKGNERNTYALLKNMILDFEQMLMPIMKKMDDGKIHLLREFFDFADKNSFSIPKYFKNMDATLYYKASLCFDLLLQNELVKETDYKEYQITPKGKEFLEMLVVHHINKISIPILAQYLEDFKYFDLKFEIGYPEDIADVQIYESKENVVPETSAAEQYKKIEEYIERSSTKANRKKKEAYKPIKLDFQEINVQKKEIGDFCEEMVFYKEKEMLNKVGRKDLAELVVWSSKELGDGLGYDIESYRNINGNYEKVYIEVKGTNKNSIDDFFVTVNELKASIEHQERYYICEIINAKKENPKIKYVCGQIDKNFKLNPILFETEK